MAQDGDGCLATVGGLDLVGKGETVQEAQEDLVEKFISWVQACDGDGSLEETLSQAGYPGVDEGTELELQFVE
jgi:hypothetical protein